MTPNIHSPNQAPSLPRPLVFRAASLTALFYLGIIVPISVAYYRKPPTFTLSDFMKLTCLSVGIGILVGMLVIWLVFPRDYAPQESHEFFPKALWVGGWHFVIFPILYLVLADISPFVLISISIQDMRDSLTLANSPILNALATTNLLAFLTYSIFFSALKLWFKKQTKKSIPSTTA